MKSYLIIATLFSAGIFSAAIVSAADGKINFVGSITDDACTVTNNVGNPLTVTLGNVSSKAFTGAGSTAAPIKFTIALTDCPKTVTSVRVTFDGTADSNVNAILALTQDDGVATGVGLQLADQNGTPVTLFTPSTACHVPQGNNSIATLSGQCR